jgi:single-strand DNA-binding protein
MDLNKVMIIGRLTRDPELKNTPNGKAVATIGLATNRIWIDANSQKQKQTEFHNIVMWGKLAEICSQYLRKGGQIYVEGRLQTREWTGQDGVKRYRTEIVGEKMIMLGSKSGEGSVSSTGGTTSYSPMPESPQEVIEEEVKVEDIPF